MSEGNGLESFGEGQEEKEVEAVEVDEEELKEEWAARGLDPAAFDPLVLLEMWEAEDAEVNKRARETSLFGHVKPSFGLNILVLV